MPQFNVYVSETMSGSVTVEAETDEEAFNIASEMYDIGDIDLEPTGDVHIEVDV